MRKDDAKALMGLLGCCCDCECEDEQDEHSRQRGTQQRRESRRAAQADTPSMPPLKRAPLLDEPLIVPPPSFDTPQRPGAFNLSPKLHIPETIELGIFTGENSDTNADQQPFIVLDNGTLHHVEFIGAVNHDLRIVYDQTSRSTTAAELAPAAVNLEHTTARRDERWPWINYDDNGVTRRITRWGYQPGGETNVQERDGGQNTTTFLDVQTHFSGQITEVERRTDVQDITVHDFDWRFHLVPPSLYPTYAQYAGEPLDVTASPAPSGETYRLQLVQDWGLNGGRSNDTAIQGHVANIWLAGDMQIGQGKRDVERFIEITEVLEREYLMDSNGNPTTTVTRTRVNAWLLIALLTEPQPSVTPPNPDSPPGTEELDSWGTVLRYVRRINGGAGVVLRDRQFTLWPEPILAAQPRFTALKGAVKVNGPRTTLQGSLSDATLIAFGQEFTGGTWAALRDPVRHEDGTWDYSSVIILHASSSTVTAIRQNKTPETCTVQAFETEVLRVPRGAFTGFNSVGAFSHSWPPEWAWARCGSETRAVIAHDAWRDSYKRDPPENSPEHWAWRSRPRKRPKVTPETAPRGLLGLSLADVAGVVVHDDPIPRGTGPVRPPIAVSSEQSGALERVNKRLLYSPAEIPDEVDDSTSLTSPITITFPPLPAPPAPPPDATVTRRAVLYVRGKGLMHTVLVDGVETPLLKLGHNSDLKNGWHPYLLNLPAKTEYTLEFNGKISLVGQCARVFVETQGQDQ